jgi:hypothetical protein
VPHIQSDPSQRNISEDIQNEVGTIGGDEPANCPVQLNSDYQNSDDIRHKRPAL